MSDILSNVVGKDEMRVAQIKTLKLAADALINAYGPYGSTTAIRKSGETGNSGFTMYTKDGHTILQKILLTGPIEMTTIENLVDITGETVKKVGDGTTSAVILSYLIFNELNEARKKYNIPEIKLVKDLQETVDKVIEVVDAHKRECTPVDIFEIAMISTNGNFEVSNAIHQIYKKHGMGVFIDVGVNNGDEHTIKEYDGLTFDQGYFSEAFINTETDKKATSVIPNANIYIFEDPIDTKQIKVFYDKIIADNIYDPMQKLANYNRSLQQQMHQDMDQEQIAALKKSAEEFAKANQVVPTVIFSPGYGNDMKSTADEMINMFAKFPIDKRPPLLAITNIHDKAALKDLATLSGAKLIKKYSSTAMMDEDIANGLAPTPDTIHNFCGKAQLVEADNLKTKVINPELMYEKNEDGTLKLDSDSNPIASDIYKNLLDNCERMYKNLVDEKKDITDIYRLKKRINSLKGNMVEYNVGGIALADRNSIKDLVEDAVLNCRSAAENGVGYGANFEALRALNELSKDITDTDSYNMYTILMKCYLELAKILYSPAVNGDAKTISLLIAKSISNGCPANIRSIKDDMSNIESDEVFDHHVLSSIKSDEVILNAISRIIGVTFATNQYFTHAPQYNIYNQEVYLDLDKK